FVFIKNPGDREFILYLPNPEEPDNHEAADFAIYAGKEMDAPANSQMKLPVVYGAVYSAFTAAIPGSEAWYYSRRDLPGVIAAGIDSDCVHANAVVPFGDKVKMIRFQISIKNRRQGEACQALICSILDHFSVKDPVELLTEPDDGKFVNMTLTDSEVREWTELLDAHREQMVFARNHQQENMVGKYQQNNPGMPTIRKELRQMLRYHNGHGATYLKKADALYQLMRLRYPDAPALKTMKKAMDEAFLELVDQFVNLGEEKVTATDDYLEIYKSHGRKAATTAIKEILEICRDLLTPEMVAALEAASGKPAAKVNTTVSIPVEAPVIDTEEQKRREAAAAAEKKRKEEEALAEKLRAVAAEKRAIEAAEAALEDMLQDVQRQRRDAERSFDRDQREIQRMASTSINIYDYNMESTVRRIVSTADRAGKSLNGTCQRLVTKLDAKCDAVYVPGVSGVLMKKIAAEFHELNETSIVEIDFTGSFEGTSFGHVGDINYQPSRESLRMEARWEQVAKEAKGLDESALLSKHGISRDAWVKHQAYEKAVTEQEKAKTSAAMRKALSALEALGDYRDAADRAADCEKKIPVLEEKEAREEQERKAREEERKRKEAEALQRYLDAHAAWEQEKKTALANREAYIEEGLKACERDLRKKLDDWYRRETEALDEKERRAKAQKEEQENLLATLGFFQFGAKSACKQQIQAAEATLAGIPGARQRLENENRQKREGIKTDVEKKKSALTAEAERKFPISQEPKRP
ncbi:MAG: hypothetical protein J6Q54_08620, partial [Oscillospiraceae bacterium]|nr:hypothetical protein [Oscillospiraceae bacterium]